MEAIKEVLPAVIKNLEVRKASLKDAPEALLKKVFSKRELKHIKFGYLKRGILNIDVDSSSWLYQLSLQKEILLAKLNKMSAQIKNIYFRLGEIK